MKHFYLSALYTYINIMYENIIIEYTYTYVYKDIQKIIADKI